VRKGRLGAAGSEERWEKRFRYTMVQRNPQTRGEATGGASKRAESMVLGVLMLDDSSLPTPCSFVGGLWPNST
jgi:hypothetical protein